MGDEFRKMDGLDKLIFDIRKEVCEELDEGDVTDDRIYEVIDRWAAEKTAGLRLSVSEKERVRKIIYSSIRGFDVLEEYLSDDSVTEIMVNGAGEIFLERWGKIERAKTTFESIERLENTAERIASRSNRLVNTKTPILDTRLEDGSRVNIVLPPVAINGPVITIRKFYDNPLTIEDLLELGSVTDEAVEFLKKAVRAGFNIFISGGTGSGKTTFLNVLSEFIPGDERIITIEDSAELKLHNVENIVSLEARSGNVENENAIHIRDFIRTSLRMRPDRIIVGEVRGAEAIDMLQAYNTGHDGSMSTGHANSAADMMTRLETMVLMGMDIPVAAIREQISAALEIVVHLGRLRDKSRRVLEISEVRGVKEGRIELVKLFEFKEEGEKDGRIIGSLKRTGEDLENKYKFQAAGF